MVVNKAAAVVVLRRQWVMMWHSDTAHIGKQWGWARCELVAQGWTEEGVDLVLICLRQGCVNSQYVA